MSFSRMSHMTVPSSPSEARTNECSNQYVILFTGVRHSGWGPLFSFPTGYQAIITFSTNVNLLYLSIALYLRSPTY
jgi:hypothetical protein